MCTAVPVEWAAGAVILATLSPKDWHDVCLDVVRRKLGAGPGGSATEEEQEGEE